MASDHRKQQLLASEPVPPGAPQGLEVVEVLDTPEVALHPSNGTGAVAPAI